jgi:hypothetical protein
MTNKQSSSADDEPTVWRVVGEDAVSLQAMVNGLAFISSKLPFHDSEISPDISAAEFPETKDLVRPVRLLAEILVARAAGAGVNSRGADRSSAIRAIDTAVQSARFRISKRRYDDALSDAAELIREIGHEYHDIDCGLEIEPDDTVVIVFVRVDLPVAYVSLFGRLMQRADSYMACDTTLALERAASTWYFYRWSDGTDAGDPLYVEFPRTVREHEWSIVSRDSLALDAPVMMSLASDESVDLPPRQRLLAAAFARSTVGIFEVTSVDGSRVIVRDVRDGLTYVVHEHDSEADPVPGVLILGRLIPIADDFWLRSPGALLLEPRDAVYRDALVEPFAAMSEQLPTPIALEAIISIAIYGATVPVDMFPAPTIAEAQAVLVEATELLAELGLIGDVPPADVPPGDVLQGDVPETMLEQLDSPALGLFGLGVDQPMAEWLAALATQAALDAPRARRGQDEGRKQRVRTKQRQKQKRKR